MTVIEPNVFSAALRDQLEDPVNQPFLKEYRIIKVGESVGTNFYMTYETEEDVYNSETGETVPTTITRGVMITTSEIGRV